MRWEGAPACPVGEHPKLIREPPVGGDRTLFHLGHLGESTYTPARQGPSPYSSQSGLQVLALGADLGRPPKCIPAENWQ